MWSLSKNLFSKFLVENTFCHMVIGSFFFHVAFRACRRCFMSNGVPVVMKVAMTCKDLQNSFSLGLMRHKSRSVKRGDAHPTFSFLLKQFFYPIQEVFYLLILQSLTAARTLAYEIGIKSSSPKHLSVDPI